MGTLQSLRKAYGALKDSTKVGLAKVNSEFKDLDIAIVKATNHVESPPKERHVRKIFSATSVVRPRADVAYCIHALSRRLNKTRNWIVALKTLIVIHRTLREGDPTFREELLNYSHRGHVLQISNFKDDSSPLAWDCSAWVRTYALFLEERLECFRILKYDIEAERWTKSQKMAKGHSRTRLLSREDLLEHLPALQQLLYRLIGCQPEGGAYHNYLIQYALALVLKESFKLYCAVNDGIINLMDLYFDMTRHDAVKALNIYKRAGQQAEHLADFYEFCKGLDLARNFQFPTLRQVFLHLPPPSCLAAMEDYIREAPRTGSVSNKRLEYHEKEQVEEKQEEPSPPEEEKPPEPEEQKPVVEEEPPQPEPEPEPEPAPLIDTGDFLGLSEINPKAAELEESNALALAIVPPGGGPQTNPGMLDFRGTNGSGWELALVTHPSSNTAHVAESKLGGGFDQLLLNSLYEDATRRQQQQHQQQQQQNIGYGYGMGGSMQSPYDPFSMSNNVAPPPNVQMALMAQQQQQQQMMFHQQQMQHHQPQQPLMLMPQQQQYLPQYPQQQMGSSNPFGDPFTFPQQPAPPQGHQRLI
ncbi:putative clathrin assembly protein At5g57200 isoform X1 [Papaver somniferum]|uniref:putative clathrin assembly protein At5g57200 isoform X1 n=1 Tax=Papaver somniferum TaxID=3469 RepID=UPI000E6FFD76|nr:putative clathrin assembly protein At5g57200 isoform X1 [Papaver somniferum]